MLHPNDLPVLAKIFNPEETTIFVLLPTQKKVDYKKIPDQLACQIRFFTDSDQLARALDQEALKLGTIINLNSSGLDTAIMAKYPKLVLIDCFDRKKETNVVSIQKFDFINNSDGTIRWIYDHAYKRPIFLNLYNNNNWKGQVFRTVFKSGFRLGLKNWLKSGSIWVTGKEIFLNTKNNGQYAIFTGTTGANRKAVVSFEQGQKATKFLKMPLAPAASQLVANELAYLKKLQEYSFRKMVIPKPKQIGNNLMVTNVCPEQQFNNKDLKGLHLAALEELYDQTVATTFLSSSNAWEGIQSDLIRLANTTIINDLPKDKVSHLHKLLLKMEQKMSSVDSLPMSIAHGDLTPWNSYLTEKAVHVYDWELAERLPLFYDAYHYIFQTSILVKRMPYSAIEKQIKAFVGIPIIQKMIAKFKIDHDQVYQFYLLRNVSYYLSRYVQQPHLHMQAHWLVDTWTKALEEEVSKISLEDEMNVSK